MHACGGVSDTMDMHVLCVKHRDRDICTCSKKCRDTASLPTWPAPFSVPVDLIVCRVWHTLPRVWPECVLAGMGDYCEEGGGADTDDTGGGGGGGSNNGGGGKPTPKSGGYTPRPAPTNNYNALCKGKVCLTITSNLSDRASTLILCARVHVCARVCACVQLCLCLTSRQACACGMRPPFEPGSAHHRVYT